MSSTLIKIKVMRRFGYFFIRFILLIPIAALAMMLLWNWLAPDLFSLSTISFWQAAGILILLRLLIGPRFGFPFFRPYGYYGPYKKGIFWRKKFYEKWKNMSDEEKEKFKEHYRYHFCHHHHAYHFSESNAGTQNKTE